MRMRHALMFANLMAALVLLYVVVNESAPMLLFAVLAGAWWFQRWGGLVTGAAVGSVFFIVSPSTYEGVVLGEQLVGESLFRLVVYASLGYTVGWLLEVRDDQAERLSALRTVQEALIPTSLDTRPGIDVAARYEPARDGVAGDFYLGVRGPGDTVIIALGDVEGKGVWAAQCAHYVRTSLISFARYETRPEQLLQLANVALRERIREQPLFCTVCVVVLSTTCVRWSTAGHHAPILAGRWLSDDGGPPLGIVEDWRGTAGECAWGVGDEVVLASDGVLEARPHGGTADDMWGDERLAAWRFDGDLDDALDGLIDALHAYAGSPADDVSVCVARRVDA